MIRIDPDEEECARLNRCECPIHWRCGAAALGRAEGVERALYVTRHPGCSSLFEPNREFLSQFPYGEAFRVERTVPVHLTALDSVCAACDAKPDVVKVDAQGSELEGGERAMASAFLVELEVEFNTIYRGQPLFGEVDSFLRSRGYGLLGLRRSAWRRTFEVSSCGGTVVHGDALYTFGHPP